MKKKEEKITEPTVEQMENYIASAQLTSEQIQKTIEETEKDIETLLSIPIEQTEEKSLENDIILETAQRMIAIHDNNKKLLPICIEFEKKMAIREWLHNKLIESRDIK
jgi:hypothetical protein